MDRNEGEKQTGDRLPDTLDPFTGSLPAPPSSREEPAYQSSDVFQLSRSAVHELWAAVDRGDTNLFPPLAAALGGLIALGDLFAGDKRAGQEFNALKQRLSAVQAIAGTPMMDTDAANSTVVDHIRATARIIERLWKAIELGASPDQSGQFVTTIHDSGGNIKDLLELLSSFLDVFEVDPRLSAVRRWGTIQEHLLEGQYALRISNHNSNTTYNFGRDVVNNNWCRVYVFSDGTDRRTPDLTKKQEKVMKAIKIAIGDRYVPEALHDTQSIDSGCMPGTRVNVLSKFMSWVKDDPVRILWLAGLAGTGKTCIAVTLCRLLLEDPDVLLGGAFFCSRTNNREERTDARRIFPTLAASLAEQSPEFAAALKESLNADSRTASKDVGVQMNQLLEQPLSALSKSPRTIVFVIDALDECSDEVQVEKLLQAIADLKSKATVKFIVTSRPETHISSSPISDSNRNIIVRLHLIDKAEVTEDIRLYITDAFSKHPSNTAWYTNANIAALAVRADGLFIFASTMVKYVLDGRGPDARRRRLQTALSAVQESRVALMPLDVMYMLVLTRASDDQKVEPRELEAMLQALACILHARSPLSVAALADLLGQDAEDLRGSLERLHAVVHVPEDLDHRSLRTLHASFGDYLLARAEPNVRMSGSLGDETLARGCFLIMERCLHFNVSRSRSSYGANGRFDNLTQPTTNSGSTHITYTLQYACNYWVYHVARQEDPSIHDATIFDTFRPRLLFWLEVMSVLGEIWRAVAILSYAAAIVKRTELSRFLRDAHAFVLASREPIERSAPHIYLSALPFEPKESLVYQVFAPYCTGLVRISVSGLRRTRDRALMTFTGHQSGVSSVACSRDGRFIASGSRDGSVQIWDAMAAAATLCLPRDRERYIISVAFSPSGRSIAYGTYGGDVHIWFLSAAQGVSQELRGHSAGVEHVEYSSNGSLLASTSRDRTIRIWNLERRQDPIVLRDLNGIFTIATFSPDSHILASGSSEGSVRKWHTATGQPADQQLSHNSLDSHTNHDITGLCFSADGRMIAACDTNMIIRLWILETGRLLIMPCSSNALRNGGRRHPVQFVGESLISAHIPRYGTEANGQLLFRITPVSGAASTSITLKGHTALVTSAAFSQDGTYLVSGSNDGTIRTWNACESQYTGQSLPMHTDVVNSVAVSPDGITIVSGSDDCSVRLWDIQTGEPRLSPLIGHTQGVTSVAIAPDGCRIASASADCTVRLWNVQTGSSCCEPLHGHQCAISSVSFSADSRMLASVSRDGLLQIWDVATGRLWNHNPLRFNADIRSVDFSSSDRHFITVDSQGRCHDRWLDLNGGFLMGEPLPSPTMPITMIDDQDYQTFSSEMDLLSLADSPEVRAIELREKLNQDGGTLDPLIASNMRDPWGSGIPFIDDLDFQALIPETYLPLLADSPEARAIELRERLNQDGGTLDPLIASNMHDPWEIDIMSITLEAELELQALGLEMDLFSVAVNPESRAMELRESIMKVVRNFRTKTKAHLPHSVQQSNASYSIAYSPNGLFVAVGLTGTIRSDGFGAYVFQTQTDELFASLSTGDERVNSMVFTPDSQSIVLSSGNRIRVWNVVTNLAQASDSEDDDDAITRLSTARIEDNWIRGPLDELLLWVPPVYQPHLQAGAVTLIIGPTRVVIDLDSNCLYHGENWTSCWRQAGDNPAQRVL